MTDDRVENSNKNDVDEAADNGAEKTVTDSTDPNQDGGETTQTTEGPPATDDASELDPRQETDTMTDTPIHTSEQIDALRADLETAREEAGRNLEGWQRSRAEFTNYKRRMDREIGQMRDRAAFDTIAQILPIIDDFERALENIPGDLQDHPWVSGTALILRKFEKLLEQHQVEPVDPVGEPFDPHRHEAIGMDDSSEYDSGIVTTTLQKGYISGERVLRPALVRVAT